MVCDSWYLRWLGRRMVGHGENRRSGDFGVGFLGLFDMLGCGAQVDDAGDVVFGGQCFPV